MSKSPSADASAATTGNEGSVAAGDTCDVTHVLPCEAAPTGNIGDGCLTDGTTAPASPLLPGGAARVRGRVSNRHEVNDAVDLPATTVTKATSSTSSAVSETDTAGLSALVETASSSHDDDDFELVLTPEDFSEAGRVITAHDTIEGPLSPGTAEGAEVEVEGRNGGTGSTVPLSPSTPDFSAVFCLSRPETDPLDLSVGTTDEDSAISPGIPTNGLLETSPSTTTPPAGKEEAGTSASGAVQGQLALSATVQPRLPSTETPEAESAAICARTRTIDEVLEVKTRVETAGWSPALSPLLPGTASSTPTPSTSSLGLTSSFAATPTADQAETPTSAATAASTPSSLTTSSLGFTPSFAATPTTDQAETPTSAATAASTAFSLTSPTSSLGLSPSYAATPTADQASIPTSATTGASAPFTRIPSTSSLGTAPSVTAKPTADQAAGTPTSAIAGASMKVTLPVGLAQAEWDNITAPILALTKVQKPDVADTLVAAENTDQAAGSPTRATAGASMGATLPSGLTQAEWDKIMAPILALTKVQNTDVTDTLVAAENVRRLDLFGERLHEAFSILNLDDDTSGEDARLERASKTAETHERLAEALEMESSDPSAEDFFSTSAKVDGAFSGWLNLLTLESPSTPHEEEARFLERVTVQTAVGEAISAMVIDKRTEDEDHKAAAAREEKMVAMEVQQREATWVARAEAQAQAQQAQAQQAQAKREEEEAKAAAAWEKQRVDLQVAQEKEAAVRATLADVKRRRAARIRRTALANVRKARDDRRSLLFPCSLHLRSMWRQGELA